MSFQHQFQAAKDASRQLLTLTAEQKNIVINCLADALCDNWKDIVSANEQDIAAEPDTGKQDRLLLTKERIEAMAIDCRNVASLTDEVGTVISQKTLDNGLNVQHVRVPLGVVGMIYESRPNVTIDAFVLAFKSGNAIVLKGGKEAIHSNRILVQIIRTVLEDNGITPEAVQFLDTTDREATRQLLEAKGLVDIIIPRGGRGLIEFVNANAKVPCIETGASVVHTYIDSPCNVEMAVNITINEKTRRVSVCNALDTLLVHQDIVETFIPQFAAELATWQSENATKVTLHADSSVQTLLSQYVSPEQLLVLQNTDYATEWLAHEMSIVVVENIDQALDHIQKYSLGHSESIVTDNPENAERFLNTVDAACVYHNASTCFSDGAQMGLGAEIGISTQKLHVRGPFALQGLTTTKWVVRGEGQTRD